ncbi:MAG TPA: hypothetical protein PK239_14465 [Chitinophagales bacterium]|nr:hypothetical protein [Chitinophagales bacterium]
MKTLLKNTAFALFLLFALLGATTGGFAQENSENQEKIKSMQVMYFTEQLQLTPDEAKGFWPLYNEYRDEVKKVNQQIRGLENDSSLSAEQKLARKNQLEEQKLTLSKRYQDQFKKVLPINKVAMIDKVERDFKMWLLNQVKQRP